MFRRVIAVGALAASALGLIVADAAPASAHSTGGPAPSNYKTVVHTIAPAVSGVTVRVVGLDGRLQLTNTTGTDVEVLGYDGEPYLRVGPGGAFENQRSPAVYRNRTRLGVVPIPPSADPKAAPEWKRVSNCCQVAWHDHRAHWMGSQPPADVRADPDTERVVSADWSLKLRQGAAVITVTGDVLWVPAPPLWPWLVGAAVIAAIVIATSRLRHWSIAIGVALALLLASDAVHLAGAYLAADLSGASWTGALLSAVAWLFGAFTLVFLARRGGVDAAPSVLVSAIAIGITGAVTDLDVLTNSQLPNALPPGLARVSVACSLGLAVGLAVAAGLRLRRPLAAPARDEPIATSA
ncbi:MAG: hypothetical protein ACOYNI_08595 [Acidimicrobiia bacterium]